MLAGVFLTLSTSSIKYAHYVLNTSSYRQSTHPATNAEMPSHKRWIPMRKSIFYGKNRKSDPPRKKRVNQW